jgi:prepilin-type N-terminal cleavage/methylation domain-containing protein
MQSERDARSHGFTLIEVLLVIAILSILAAIVIVAINPSKQFGEAQNAQRRSDIEAILNATHQYSLDNGGTLPGGGSIVTGTDCMNDGVTICRSQQSCDGANMDELIYDEKYLVDIPHDPVEYDDNLTGYSIMSTENGRIVVCAPNFYGDEEISVSR